MDSEADSCCSIVNPAEEPPVPSLPLPFAFLDFLSKNGVDPSVYELNDSIPRYIRIKPGNESDIQEIEDELKCKLQDVDWLEGFFAIPPYIQIAGSSVYRQGKIYGMDAASGAAVQALNVSLGDHVLDLCAAPTKISSLSNYAAEICNWGSMQAICCRWNIFLVVAYESEIKKRSCSGTGKNGNERVEDVFKEWSSKRSWSERKSTKKTGKTDIIPGKSEPELIFYGRHSGVVGLSKSEIFEPQNACKTSELGYDKVLVDAECTHDGSIKHIQKFEQWGWETLQRRLLDTERTNGLMHLQLQLLSNGFKLLRNGGSLVYSTCSLTIAQNETIVEQFLSRNPHAELVEIDAVESWPCKTGRISKTLRFDPFTSQTSGLFIAKLEKHEK